MNPLGDLPFENNEQQFTVEHLNNLETKYTMHLAAKSYDQINNDLLEYSDLYDNISKIVVNTPHKNMKLLFKISLQGLAGAIHAFHLNKQNIELNIENLVVKNKLETILSGKNFKPMNEMNSSIAITKTFTLAPLYSYYIVLFGTPENGFEPEKLKQIANFMQKYSIDLYR
jgi:hypothetical protein